ncbi:hypothetical protein [Terriglobus sp.]|uniref:hypothetical protein n=1 Tax=Terriglobus sp. TaxID=1889013 RepID=UPI003AFF830C
MADDSKKLFDPVSGDEMPKVDNAVAVGEDLRFQERWWTFERIVWSVFALILLADVLGVFGRGWLAKAELKNENSGMQVKYERVQRAMTPSVVSIQFLPAAVHNGNVQLYVSNSVVKDLGESRVIPEPEHSTIGDGGVLYSFPTQGREPLTVDLELQSSFPGVHPFTLQVPGMQATGSRVVVMP